MVHTLRTKLTWKIILFIRQILRIDEKSIRKSRQRCIEKSNSVISSKRAKEIINILIRIHISDSIIIKNT